MAKELIYTNTDTVRNTIDYINRSKGYLQGVYDAFKTIGITPALSDISACMHVISRKRELSELEDWIVNYLAWKIENPAIEGIPVSRESLKNLREKPDCSSLFDEFNTLFYNISPGGDTRLNLDSYFVIENEEVKVKNDLSDILTEENSVYAITDKQIEVLAKIKDLLAAWDAFYVFALENNLRNREQWVGDMSDLSFFDIKNKKIVLGERTARYIKSND
jgi:hypothetical protein